MMNETDRVECLAETLQELREDARMLSLVLHGVRVPTDRLSLDCLLRLSDYLNQHVTDVCILCKQGQT